MHKDVKLAFIVGALLIAVLVVYVLKVPSGPGSTDQSTAPLETTGVKAEGPSIAGDTGSVDKISAISSDKIAADKLASEKATPDKAIADQPIGEKAIADKTAAGKSQDIAKSDNATGESVALSGATTKPTDPFASTGQDTEDRWMLALNRGTVPMMTSAAPQPLGISKLPVTLEAKSPSTQPAGHESISASAGMRTHVVQKGETISKIAQAAYGSPNYYPHIIRANPGMVAEKIKPGMTINLPAEADVKAAATSAAASTSSASPANGKADIASAAVDPRTQYQVQSGDSLAKISMKLYGNSMKWQAIYDLNKEAIGTDPAKLKLRSVLKLPEAPTQTAH